MVRADAKLMPGVFYFHASSVCQLIEYLSHKLSSTNILPVFRAHHKTIQLPLLSGTIARGGRAGGQLAGRTAKTAPDLIIKRQEAPLNTDSLNLRSRVNTAVLRLFPPSKGLRGTAVRLP
ncbi:unnamed protein product [Leptosia nina]|uniref:Uncharacterized protein n=1 Tax=Leptosia nina TaxID=320188 RepID=A0AAV1JBC6_9NEOP